MFDLFFVTLHCNQIIDCITKKGDDTLKKLLNVMVQFVANFVTKSHTTMSNGIESNNIKSIKRDIIALAKGERKAGETVSWYIVDKDTSIKIECGIIDCNGRNHKATTEF